MRSSLSALALSSVAFLAPAAIAADLSSSITVDGLELVSTSRVGRTTFDYVYRVRLRNAGAPATDVVVRGSGGGTGLTLVDADVSAGPVSPGLKTVAGDTVRFRQDRSFPFTPSAIIWSITGTPGGGSGSAGNLSFIAGDLGGWGSSDGPATLQARLGPQIGVWSPPGGDVVIGDLRNSVLRRLGSDGQVTTVAGRVGLLGTSDGVGTAARLGTPSFVTGDRAGNVYFIDALNIRRQSPSGEVRTIFRMPTGGFGGSVNSVAVDGSGNLYYTRAGLDYAVYKVSFPPLVPTGSLAILAGTQLQSGSVDGPGALARFAGPQDLVVDSFSNIIVKDGPNQTLRRIAPDGTVTTLAGATGQSGSTDGPPGVARFTFPMIKSTVGATLALGGNDDVYLVDGLAGERVRRVSSAGVVTTVFVDAEFRSPPVLNQGTRGLASGLIGATPFDGPVATAGLFVGNLSIAVEPNGGLLLANSSAVRRLAGGQLRTIAGSLPLSGAFAGSRGWQPSGESISDLAGVAVDNNEGVIFCGGIGDDNVARLSATGVASGYSDDPQLRFCTDVAYDRLRGIAYAAVRSAIYRVDSAGVTSLLAGSPQSSGRIDGQGSAARFGGSLRLAVGPAGDVFVADTGNDRIRRVAPDGTVTTVAGGGNAPVSADGPALQATLVDPLALDVDALGNVYFAETGRVRRLGTDGEVRTVTARPLDDLLTLGFYSAPLALPVALKVESAGSILVANRAGYISRIDASGVITTVAGDPLEVRTKLGPDPRLNFIRDMEIAGPRQLLITTIEGLFRLELQ